jgi:5-formyltetrahydrofolate cyclo-ligase
MDRNALRQEARRRRRRLCADEARALSQAVWMHLFDLPAYRLARRLLIYVAALENEVHTSGVLEEALGRGAEVYVPRTHRRERRLSVHRLTDLGQLAPGEFGIPEVAEAGQAEADPRLLDAAIVPGLAFDRAGRRLGYGQGYFDRFLKGLALQRIGLAYGFQLVPELPSEPWDVPMHWVVTDACAIDCRRPPCP